MTAAQLYRFSGLVLVIGMILSAVSSIVIGVAFPDIGNPAATTNPVTVLLNVMGVVGTTLELLGLPGMYARAARAGGRVWLVGVVLIAISAMLFGIFGGLTSAIVFPLLASQAPDFLREPPASFIPLDIVATLAYVFGAILMAIPMITKGIYRRWCGYALMVAAVLAVVSFVVSAQSSVSLLAQTLNVVSELPLFLAVGWTGFELWSGNAQSSELVARSVAPQPA